MPTIIIEYYEQVLDPATNVTACNLLGSETLDGVEEALLPAKTDPLKPIFFTKKFSSSTFYRWLVLDVVAQPLQQGSPTTYKVTLERHTQLSKTEYFSYILKAKGYVGIKNVLHKYALVEVEFGHAPLVGKSNGDIRSNKRYPDSVQNGNMPKRRLAIVLSASRKGNGAVVQVVPISSVPPQPGDKTALDVTASLKSLVNYKKQSWAICSMVETVAATRIIAPMVDWGKGGHARDIGFKSKLDVSLRAAFETALLYGLDRAAVLIQQNHYQTLNQSLNKQISAQQQHLESLQQQVSTMQQELISLQNKYLYADVHEEMARFLAGVMGEGDFEAFRRDEFASS